MLAITDCFSTLKFSSPLTIFQLRQVSLHRALRFTWWKVCFLSYLSRMLWGQPADPQSRRWETLSSLAVILACVKPEKSAGICSLHPWQAAQPKAGKKRSEVKWSVARRGALEGNSGTEAERGARRRDEGRRAGGSTAAGRAEWGSPQACRALWHLLGPRRVLARLRRLPPELRAEPSLPPVLPPPAPSAPRGSAGCLRRPLRWEEEEEEAPRAATGAGSKAK